jgi:hypothetical protein
MVPGCPTEDSIAVVSEQTLPFCRAPVLEPEGVLLDDGAVKFLEIKKERDLEANVGDKKNIWGRVVQTDGSKAGTAVFCTTMKLTQNGAGNDTWEVTVPAGSLTDSDFWDATELVFQEMDCGGETSRSTIDSLDFGQVAVARFARPIDYIFDEDPWLPMAFEPFDWDFTAVVAAGYDFAVIGYEYDDGGVQILEHLDEVAITCLSVHPDDAFGTGAPLDFSRLHIYGLDLDAKWDKVASSSNGLHERSWNNDAQSIVTDQGSFQILKMDRLDSDSVEVAHFVRGDANSDLNYDLSDPIFTLGWLFLGASVPACQDAADFDDSGRVDLADVISSLYFMMLGGSAPAMPFPEPGPDVEDDDLPTCDDATLSTAGF